MRTILSILLLGMALASCKTDNKTAAAAEAPAAEKTTNFLITPGEGFGDLKGPLTRAAIEGMFEKGQVVARELYLGEGQSQLGLVVFPDSPEEVEIVMDENNTAVLYRLSQEDSQWATAEGVKVGSSLADLEKLNGKPISFMGFDWDFGGAVTEWNGGKLQGKSFMVTLAYGKDVQIAEEDASKMMGDQIISSTSPVLAKYGIKVDRIMQNY